MQSVQRFFLPFSRALLCLWSKGELQLLRRRPHSFWDSPSVVLSVDSC